MKSKAVLSLTSPKICNEVGVNFFLRNDFSKSQVELIENLSREAEANNFVLKISNAE